MPKKILYGLGLSLLPAFAFAHPGHGDAGFANAFAHPFTGSDHLLMMLCVGVWAGRIGGRARWQLPATFLAAMLAGWLLGAQGFAIAGVENGIAAGLIAVGVVFISQAALSRAWQMVITAAFALLHGMAHGVELGATTAFLSAAGFLSAAALLHGCGIALYAVAPKHNAAIYRGLGAALALAGGGMLVAA